MEGQAFIYRIWRDKANIVLPGMNWKQQDQFEILLQKAFLAGVRHAEKRARYKDLIREEIERDA